ncbi:enhancer of polycomb homolog 1-like isoform X13 [Brienomyrus brachyistius]|uniref:enhancer of polycomb homolog 1-like isoform X13 n=1 Tax=Brienomyrus brachyistius TaxID=42636 RepID=UPI0020B419B6|nr:enhancer of polycomb homolog 1-like isoform X13 [Brienomyrus brachyistius]
MSKLSFRARALDAAKPLPVFRCEDLPDLHEYASINRAVPQMPTGMEKEEESEHHLQRAISAQQVYGEKRDNMVIPVPQAESNIAYYETLYPGEFRMPKQLIHLQPFSLDTEQPDYDLDSEDDVFLNKLKKKMEITPLQFEEMVDRLEKGSGQQLVTLQEAKLLLKEDDELIREVFEYWTRKRRPSESISLLSGIKQEKRDGSSTNDPYVAFRRRTEKMQTRKNRKNDEASYEKMLKLRRDLSRAVTILEMIKRREKSKRELLHLTLEIVEKRYSMADFGGEVMAEVLAQRALVKPTYPIPIIPLSSSNQHRHQDHMEMKEYKAKPEKTEVVRTKRKYEKKPKVLPLSASVPQQTSPSVFSVKDLNQYDFPSSDDEPFSQQQIQSGSSDAEEENDPDGPFAFRRRAGCQYYAPREAQGASGWPWCSPSEGGLGDVLYRYCLTSLSVPRRCVGLARRRIGRGGRVLLDRAHTDFDDSIDGPDPEQLVPLPRSLADDPTGTSDTNTSDRGPSHDLNRILSNIKASRWRHFRPRTPPPQNAHGGEAQSHRPCQGLSRLSAAQSGTLAGGPPSQNRRGGSTAAFPAVTAEQYQQHQEQLALMQKQQLAQTQLQLSSSTQGLVSKTLDSVSAQFAASALVTKEQLISSKPKEEVVLGAGVNGVVQASGRSICRSCKPKEEVVLGAGVNGVVQASGRSICMSCKPKEEVMLGAGVNGVVQASGRSICRSCKPKEEVMLGAGVNGVVQSSFRSICRSCKPKEEVVLGAGVNGVVQASFRSICMSCKPKEEVVLGASVNGVVQASGRSICRSCKPKEEVVLGAGVNGVVQASFRSICRSCKPKFLSLSALNRKVKMALILLLFLMESLFFPPGVYKGLHLSSTTTVPPPMSQPVAAGSTFPQPATNSSSSSSSSTNAVAISASEPAHHTPAANSTTQVLIGNSMRLGLPPPGGAVATLNTRHPPRTIGAVPSALKLAAPTNCQMPKVAATSSMDMVPRENHEQEKAALNSIADTTVVMEVT